MTRPIDGANIFSIQKYIEIQKCYGLNHAGNKQVTSTFFTNKISDKFQQQHGYCPVDIQKDLQCELCVKVMYSITFRQEELLLHKSIIHIKTRTNYY